MVRAEWRSSGCVCALEGEAPLVEIGVCRKQRLGLVPPKLEGVLQLRRRQLLADGDSERLDGAGEDEQAVLGQTILERQRNRLWQRVYARCQRRNLLSPADHVFLCTSVSLSLCLCVSLLVFPFRRGGFGVRPTTRPPRGAESAGVSRSGRYKAGPWP